MSFKRFRDCPICDERLRWFDIKLYDTEDCWGITCRKCGHHLGGWVNELPFVACSIYYVKLLIDKMLYKYVTDDFGDNVPTVVKQHRFIKRNWRWALRYYTKSQRGEIRKRMEVKVW